MGHRVFPFPFINFLLRICPRNADCIDCFNCELIYGSVLCAVLWHTNKLDVISLIEFHSKKVINLIELD